MRRRMLKQIKRANKERHRLQDRFRAGTYRSKDGKVHRQLGKMRQAMRDYVEQLDTEKTVSK